MQASFKRSIIRRVVAVLLLSLGPVSCISCVPRPPKSLHSQLELREFQTRSYTREEKSTITIMKAMLNVLQDDGYIVRNADKDLGFLVATKETDVEEDWTTAFSVLFEGAQARYPKNTVMECSVHISELGSEVKVRAVFQKKLLDNQGGTLDVRQIEEPDFYREFFAKVDKGIYLERQKF